MVDVRDVSGWLVGFALCDERIGGCRLDAMLCLDTLASAANAMPCPMPHATAPLGIMRVIIFMPRMNHSRIFFSSYLVSAYALTYSI